MDSFSVITNPSRSREATTCHVGRCDKRPSFSKGGIFNRFLRVIIAETAGICYDATTALNSRGVYSCCRENRKTGEQGNRPLHCDDAGDRNP